VIEPDFGRYRPSTYGDRFADVYDDWYADVSDVDATVARVVELVDLVGASEPARVLELGIGSGRLAIPLAQQGLEVWGVDASTAMLDRLRAKPGSEAIQVVSGDIARLVELDPLDPTQPGTPRFDVVLCAFNTLFNLTAESDQRRCVAHAAQVLAPDGFLVIEAFIPPLPVGAIEGEDVEQPPTPEAVVEPRQIGLDEVILTVSRHDPTDQTVTGQHIQLREDGVRLHPWRIRYASTTEIDRWAEAAGLELAERHAGWGREPFDDSASVHVSVYRHPSL
jgi:SAM-dependent methyltransferase